MQFRHECEKSIRGTQMVLARATERDGRQLPKSDLYSPANRPNCQKPNRVAISVTVVAVGALSRSARRTKCIRRIKRYCLGLTPSISLEQVRKVRSDAPTVAQTSGIKKRFVRFFLHHPAKSAHDRGMLSQGRPVLAGLALPRQPTVASISACSRPCAASGWAMTAGACSASCPAASCRRWSFAMAALDGANGQGILWRR